MTYKLINHDRGTEKEFENKEDAKERKQEMGGLGAPMSELEIVKVEDSEESNQSESKPKDATPVEQAQEERDLQKAHEQNIQQAQEIVDRVDAPDPNTTLPTWMLSEIEHHGEISVDLNKRGTQVVANALGLEVNAECEIEARETDFEYCRYRATAETKEGQIFNAVGDCHVNESGKDKWDLERMAETRAKKRAVKWASAGGIAAFEEFGENHD